MVCWASRCLGKFVVYGDQLKVCIWMNKVDRLSQRIQRTV